jgi:histidine ammonia-lyase
MRINFEINDQWISLESIDNILEGNQTISISEERRSEVRKCRAYLDQKVLETDRLIYGVNTGFGSLCNTAISKDELGQLQRNLVLSHACGSGERVPDEIVRRMLLLKVIGLSVGNSGVQEETLERLIWLFNNDFLPVVYQLGSLGASGDLAPLAHLSLPLLGEGELSSNGTVSSSAEVLAKHNLSPITLKSKEGLALLNGTQFMSAYASYSVSKSKRLWIGFNTVAALSLEAYDGRIEPFQSNVNEIRRQHGQIETARLFRELLNDSQIMKAEKKHVQDPYSFRCIPQVHGASKDTIDHCALIVEREINAVTDNPTIFPDEDDVVSAGNFHGQPLALAMDFLAIALAEMGSISERRVYKLISGTRELPPFLVAEPGLNSGFMIPQYTAASIVSQNKQLCMPASVDSIDSSNGQEDHVSMGANAGTKLHRVVQNCYRLLGIELLNAAQAMHFRSGENASATDRLLKAFRAEVPVVMADCYMHPLLKSSEQFVREKF